jgi:Staphylococcal nuclease homologue
VSSGTVVVEEIVAHQPTPVGVVQHHDVVEALAAEGADEPQRDRYGRLLAYVYTDFGTHVNAELVSRGYAAAATFPPNVRNAEYYRALERNARSQNRGLWGNVTATAAYTTLPGTVEAQALTSEGTSGSSYSGSTGSAASSGYSGSSSGGSVSVRGYTRSDGTYVAPYTRSAPGRGGGRRR